MNAVSRENTESFASSANLTYSKGRVVMGNVAVDFFVIVLLLLPFILKGQKLFGDLNLQTAISVTYIVYGLIVTLLSSRITRALIKLFSYIVLETKVLSKYVHGNKIEAVTILDRLNFGYNRAILNFPVMTLILYVIFMLPLVISNFAPSILYKSFLTVTNEVRIETFALIQRLPWSVDFRIIGNADCHYFYQPCLLDFATISRPFSCAFSENQCSDVFGPFFHINSSTRGKSNTISYWASPESTRINTPGGTKAVLAVISKTLVVEIEAYCGPTTDLDLRSCTPSAGCQGNAFQTCNICTSPTSMKLIMNMNKEITSIEQCTLSLRAGISEYSKWVPSSTEKSQFTLEPHTVPVTNNWLKLNFSDMGYLNLFWANVNNEINLDYKFRGIYSLDSVYFKSNENPGFFATKDYDLLTSFALSHRLATLFMNELAYIPKFRLERDSLNDYIQNTVKSSNMLLHDGKVLKNITTIARLENLEADSVLGFPAKYSVEGDLVILPYATLWILIGLAILSVIINVYSMLKLDDVINEPGSLLWYLGNEKVLKGSNDTLSQVDMAHQNQRIVLSV